MRILVALAAALHCAAAVAQLYSWKDAGGKVHYSDEPPPNQTPTRKLKAAPPPANPPVAPATKAGEKDAEAAKKAGAENAAKAEKDKADAEQRRVNCERARSNLAAIESGAARFTLNAKGERVALEGAVLQAELDSARKAVEGWCK